MRKVSFVRGQLHRMIGAHQQRKQFMSLESQAYEKHKNLRLAAQILGINIQTLYARLKSQGVSVTGDKARHGSSRDKLAARAESLFTKLVPNAIDQSGTKLQSRFDFLVENYKVDVKVSSKNASNTKRPDSKRWAFLLTKQRYECDYFCCICLGDDGASVEKVLFVPTELADVQTMSVTCNGGSKWDDFAIEHQEIPAFFDQLPKRDAPIDVEPQKATGLSI